MSAKYVLQMSFSIQDAANYYMSIGVFFHRTKTYAITPPPVLDDSDIL